RSASRTSESRRRPTRGRWRRPSGRLREPAVRRRSRTRSVLSPDDARAEMVAVQLRERGIADERVLEAMGAVPRELFVPDELRDRAYEDAALPIGEGQTISQPYMVARICEELSLRGHERVL